MTSTITSQYVFDHLKDRLKLVCLGGSDGMGKVIRARRQESSAPSFVGHLNFIHPNRVQVLGKRELEYLARQGKNSRTDALEQLFSGATAMVIVAEKQDVPDDFISLSSSAKIPLLKTTEESQDVISHFQYFVGNLLADSLILHGVFMEVMGSGVLLIGDSAVGKSELALELISRGHRLIADDAPEFTRVAPDIINGTCPPLLREFLEVRGLGVLNIRSIFGDSAIKTSKYLRLIISLEKMTEETMKGIDRLRGSRKKRDVLGVNIPEITLPVAPGRNLAVAVETAVRNHILLLKGYDAAEDFILRQQKMLEQDPT